MEQLQHEHMLNDAFFWQWCCAKMKKEPLRPFLMVVGVARAWKRLIEWACTSESSKTVKEKSASASGHSFFATLSSACQSSRMDSWNQLLCQQISRSQAPVWDFSERHMRLTSFHPTAQSGNLCREDSHKYPEGFPLQPLLSISPSLPTVASWNGTDQQSSAMSPGAVVGILRFEGLLDLAQRRLQQIALHSSHLSIAALQSVCHPMLGQLVLQPHLPPYACDWSRSHLLKIEGLYTDQRTAAQQIWAEHHPKPNRCGLSKQLDSHVFCFFVAGMLTTSFLFYPTASWCAPAAWLLLRRRVIILILAFWCVPITWLPLCRIVILIPWSKCSTRHCSRPLGATGSNWSISCRTCSLPPQRALCFDLLATSHVTHQCHAKEACANVCTYELATAVDHLLFKSFSLFKV